MAKSNELKRLESELSQLNQEIENRREEVKHKQRELGKKCTYKQKLEQRIQSFKQSNELTVSEHAIVRFLDRVQGFPTIEEIEGAIVTNELHDFLEHFDFADGEYPVTYYGQTLKAVVKNRTIVTIK